MKTKLLFLITLVFSYLLNAQCNEPTNLNLLIDYDTAINWDTNGQNLWDIEYGEHGFTPTGIPTVENLNSNYFYTYQMPSSVYYDVYVRTDCGTETSNWVGPITFYNYCVNLENEYEINENFDTFLPNCWTLANQGTPETEIVNYNSSLWESGFFANTGSNNAAKININGNNRTDWLISPLFSGDIPIRDMKYLDYLELNLEIALTQNNSTETATLGSDDKIEILISPNNGKNWYNLVTWDSNSTISNTGETINLTYSNYTDIDFENSYKYLIAIWATSGTIDDNINVDFFVDNIYSFALNEGGSVADLKSKGFTYYPNPIKNTLNINANENIDNITIYNYLGQEVKNLTINSVEKEINLNNLEKGIYFMKVQIDTINGFVSLVKE